MRGKRALFGTRLWLFMCCTWCHCRFKAIVMAPVAIIRAIAGLAALLLGWAVCSLVLIGEGKPSCSDEPIADMRCL